MNKFGMKRLLISAGLAICTIGSFVLGNMNTERQINDAVDKHFADKDKKES